MANRVSGSDFVRRTRELYQKTEAAIEIERNALDDAKYAFEAPRVALEQNRSRPRTVPERRKIVASHVSPHAAFRALVTFTLICFGLASARLGILIASTPCA